MNVLSEKGFECPKVVRDKEGRGIRTVWIQRKEQEDSTRVLLCLDDDANGFKASSSHNNSSIHQCRLLTYLPGQTLYDVTITTDLLFQMGEYTAIIQDALKEFDHPALHDTTLMWTLDAVPKLKDLLQTVPTPGQLDLVLSVFNTLDSMKPKLDQAKRGAIYGDLNASNIILMKSSEKSSSHNIKGIIDFGDMHFSVYVYELGTVIMYMMLEGRELDLLEIGRHVLAGYQSVTALSHTELELVRLCVAVRYAQSLVIGEYSSSKEPDNEYLTITPKVGWPQLEKFWGIPRDELFAIWQVSKSK